MLATSADVSRMSLTVSPDQFESAIARVAFEPWSVVRAEAFNATRDLALRAVYNMALLHVQSLYRA